MIASSTCLTYNARIYEDKDVKNKETLSLIDELRKKRDKRNRYYPRGPP